MKKITYLFLFLLVLGSCKFDPNPYSFDREFDGGTYITREGIVKYISGTSDSAVTVQDNYALLLEEILYVKLDEAGNNFDSILIFGFCYSETPNPFASPPDSLITLERIKRYSVIEFEGSSQPESFMTTDQIYAGKIFKKGVGLLHDKDYYIKSFVVTGRFKDGDPVYEHIAYNQSELYIHTKVPEDRWIGGTDYDAPADFPDNEYRGGTSFTYDGYMFVTQGHNEDGLGSRIEIDRYDPVSNTWDRPYDGYTVSSEYNFTDAVAFVIEDCPIGNNNYRDCVFIGTGRILFNGTASKEFYRLDLEQGQWLNITSTHGAQTFPGNARYNAVAFSINGIGYVGLGTLSNGSVLEDFYKFDPSDRNAEEHAYGFWERIDDFPGGTRTKAVTFKLEDKVYVSCGENDGGTYMKDVRMCQQTTGDWLSWSVKAEFLGTARIDAVGFNIGEMGFIGTGWDGDSARSDFYRYNPFINHWEQRAYYSGEARFEAVGQGVEINENDYRGYIGTGWDSTQVIGSRYYNDFWYYRP